MDLLCKWCRETKPEELFVKREAGKPYSQANVRCCRECNRARNKARYENDPCVRRKQLQANADWRMAHPERMRQHGKTFDLRFPSNARARNRVRYLVRRGFWQAQPCVVCGSQERVEAHHDSYAEPHWETVRWLCKRHHETWHQRIDPMKREILEESLVEAAKLRDEAVEVQRHVTELRSRLRELLAKADAVELAAWNRVLERTEPMFQEFLRGGAHAS